MSNQVAVDRWLAKFEDLCPADGQLTQEILDAVGPPPLPVRGPASTPEGARGVSIQRAADIGGLRAGVRTRVNYMCDRFLAEAHEYEKKGDHWNAAKLEAKA